MRSSVGIIILKNENFFFTIAFRSGEQQFALTWRKDIRPEKRPMCWDVSSSDARAPVLLWNCHGAKGNQLWRYNPVNLFF